MSGTEKAAPPVLKDLHERLVRAEDDLRRMSAGRRIPSESDRLWAKASGVALARSYVDEYLRGAHATYTTTPDNTDSVVSP